MIQLDEPNWESENASELRAFLRSVTGQRLLASLVYGRPGFMPSSAHPHKSFAGSREIHGYEQAVKKLLGLTEAEHQPLNPLKAVSDAYPALDDDSQWGAEIPK